MRGNKSGIVLSQGFFPFVSEKQRKRVLRDLGML